jgi:serine/threonine-protein kinase
MIELRTFGALELRDADAHELRAILAQPKRLALLAYLAVAHDGGFCRRDTIVAVFWPELDEDHARGALRQAVRFLRRSLGPDVLESRGEEEIGVRKRAFRCDAVTFAAAVARADFDQALALYRGQFLESFFVAQAPAFERWLERKREELRWSAFHAASTLAAMAEREHQLASAADWARRAAVLAPFDESARRRLISLLGLLGDRAGAMHAYDEFARRLAYEYELEPAPETKTLVGAICPPTWHPAADAGDRAFEWLDRAYEERSAWLRYFKLEPRLDPPRCDARFTALLERLQLDALAEPATVPSGG